ncbi:TIR domain-containing protein [Streptomyces sp. NPDC006906]|uniref:TIR domain-containing protein n=1 Tax=Streptomyces sp. NPDC006906 TaxID=3154782 RepID=UPI0033C4849F
MARRNAFYSFHYIPDNWRAAQVRNMGVLEGNQPASDNDWEKVKQSGNSAIKNWIDAQLRGRSCTVVLIGSGTAGRPWINYEIEKSWADGKGVVGIYIHGLQNREGRQSVKGSNPFRGLIADGVLLSATVKAYDPPFASSQYVYGHIKNNLATWVEEAIAIRQKH